MKTPPEDEGVPSKSRAELAKRIEEVIAKIGGPAAAVDACGFSESTIQRWAKGTSDPSFEGLAKLAASARKSLDWLAYGEPGQPGFAEEAARFCAAHGPPPLDDELLARSIALTLEMTEGIGKSPEAMAYLIVKAYRHALRERAAGGSSEAPGNGA